MPRVFLLALALASSAGGALQPPASPEPSIVLELRIFLGPQEVTPDTRVTVHRGGERANPIAQTTPHSGRLEVTVPAGIYDVQAIREQEGKVANIRWAERLVVMPYPDERGHHLEVLNFTAGYGALEIRMPKSSAVPDVALFKAGHHDRPAAALLTGDGYALFVVPAGNYDIQVRGAGKPSWHTAIEVPLDRTRFWLVPLT